MKFTGTVAIIALAILALLSAVSIALTATNYKEGMGAAKSLRLELSNLELLEEDEPKVVITFHLENQSPLSMRLETMHFSLYLNRNFVGSNYEPFTAKTLRGFEETAMRFVIPLRPFYLQHVQQAREEENFSWFLSGMAKLVLPFNEDVVWLDLRESLSGE